MNNLALSLASPDRSAYADAVGFIRVKEKRDLLNQARMQDLLSLGPRGIREKLRQGLAREVAADREGFDALLGALLDSDYAEVEAFDHQRLVVPLLRYRHDIHNLKSLLRKKLTGADPFFSPVRGFFPVKVLEEAVFAGRRLPWPGPIGLTLDDILERADGHAAGDWIDLRLDLAWIEHARESSVDRRMPLLAHWARCLEDFAAVKYLWRRQVASRLYCESYRVDIPLHFLGEGIREAHDRERLADSLLASPYGSSLKEGAGEWRARGSFALLDRDMDNHLLGVLSAAKYISMGPEPLAAYLLARESDMRNIRAIHHLGLAGWPESAVKRQLRRLYV